MKIMLTKYIETKADYNINERKNEQPRSKLRGIITTQTILIGLNVTSYTPFLFLDFSNIS